MEGFRWTPPECDAKPLNPLISAQCGEVAEWLKAHDSKTHDDLSEKFDKYLIYQ